MPYNITAIRELMQAAFNDEELKTFCYDHFRPVYDEFAEGMGRLWKIHLLIEHCDRHGRLGELLDYVKNANPVQYDKFIDEITAPPPPPEIDASCSSIQVEIVLSGNASDLGPGLRFAFVGALADILNIPRDQIRVLEVCGGSIVVRAEMPTEAAEHLIDLYHKNDPAIQDLGIQEVRRDFTFQDRRELCDDILDCRANHIELYGPCGVGKTYLLKHIGDMRENVRAVYIDLNEHSDVDEILQEVVTQLTGQEPQSPVTIIDLVSAIKALRNPETGQPINHFLSLFDSATERHQELIRWLISREGLINSQRFLALLDHQGVANIAPIRDERRRIVERFLDLTKPIGPGDVKLQVVIAVRRPIVRSLIESFHPNFRFQQFAIDRLEKRLNPEEDPIQGMLNELARHRKLPRMTPEACQELGDKIYYITGGHPKCAKRVLFAVADADFAPEREQWRDFFKEHALPTIEKEMLGSIDDCLLDAFQVLSIFRRFDQHVLRTLFERQILPSAPDEGEITPQARRLRAGLVKTYLVNEPDDREPMFTMNLAVRRALALRMRYRDPPRYRELNQTALDIFRDWLRHIRAKPERSIVSLIESAYHKFQILEVDLDQGTDPSLKVENISGLVQAELGRHLQLLREAIDEDDLPKIKAFWEKDDELKETAERVTGDPQCYYVLSRRIDDFVATSLEQNTG